MMEWKDAEDAEDVEAEVEADFGGFAEVKS